MDLADWRTRINDLDNQILNLLHRRAEAALQIGNLKRRQGTPSYVPEREAEMLRQLSAQNHGLLTADNLAAIWREVLSACRALEGPLTVAYLGPQATFTHQAALGRFGATVDFRPVRTIADIFDEVERGRAAFGVVPVENHGLLTADNLAAIWREVLSACRALEGPLTVAYLGPQATFTHQAALGRFGATVDFRPVRTIADIFDEVERGRAAFGVVPVE